MSDFNIKVGLTPDKGLKASIKPKVLVAAYGDGYEQRTSSHINNRTESWSLSWKNRSTSDTERLLEFFEEHKGYKSFKWYPPGSAIENKMLGGTIPIPGRLIDNDQYFTENTFLGGYIVNNRGRGAEAYCTLDPSGYVDTIVVTKGGSGYRDSPAPTVDIGSRYYLGSAADAVVSKPTDPYMAYTGTGYVASVNIPYPPIGGTSFVTPPPITIVPDRTIAKIVGVDGNNTLIHDGPADFLQAYDEYSIYPSKRFVCEKWDVTSNFSGIQSITATFRQVLEP